MDHVAQPLEPPHAKLVGGVWLPEGERHFVEMMLHNKKRRHVEDGKYTYQWHKIQAVLRALPADRRRVCLDIGAHVGLWAMWLVREFEHVHSFEPVAAHADIYPFNMPSDNYTLHRCALGETEGAVRIELDPEQSGCAHVGGPGEIPMRTLDSFGFERVDLIKIDVEGYELPVVRGATETILRCRPVMIVEQKGNDAKTYGQPRDAALGYLKGLGLREIHCIAGESILGW